MTARSCKVCWVSFTIFILHQFRQVAKCSSSLFTVMSVAAFCQHVCTLFPSALMQRLEIVISCSAELLCSTSRNSLDSFGLLVAPVLSFFGLDFAFVVLARLGGGGFLARARVSTISSTPQWVKRLCCNYTKVVDFGPRAC